MKERYPGVADPEERDTRPPPKYRNFSAADTPTAQEQSALLADEAPQGRIARLEPHSPAIEPRLRGALLARYAEPRFLTQFEGFRDTIKLASREEVRNETYLRHCAGDFVRRDRLGGG